jgi:hypothetical protein
MDIQAKIANALADFDDLLAQGLSLEAALRIASEENEVTERALAARASREMSLEERRQKVNARVEADRKAAVSVNRGDSQQNIGKVLAEQKAMADFKADFAANPMQGYYRRLRSGKKVWVDLSQLKLDF